MNKLLPYLEKILIAALLIGLLLNYFEIENAGLVNISLAGLAVTFFLNAFKPINTMPTEESEDQVPLGFSDLLGATIVPKVLGIASAVGIMGILFYNLDLGNDGYKQMLSIGGSTILLSSLILGYMKITGVKNLETPMIGVFKAIPIILTIYYILFMTN